MNLQLKEKAKGLNPFLCLLLFFNSRVVKRQRGHPFTLHDQTFTHTVTTTHHRSVGEPCSRYRLK